MGREIPPHTQDVPTDPRSGPRCRPLQGGPVTSHTQQGPKRSSELCRLKGRGGQR